MTNLVRRRLASEDNKEFNGSVPYLLIHPHPLCLSKLKVEWSEMVESAFLLFSFSPFFQSVLEVRQILWFFLHGVPATEISISYYQGATVQNLSHSSQVRHGSCEPVAGNLPGIARRRKRASIQRVELVLGIQRDIKATTS